MACSVLCVYSVMYGMLYVLYAHRVQYMVCVGIGYGVWYVVWYVWCVHCVFMVCSMFHVWYHTAYLSFIALCTFFFCDSPFRSYLHQLVTS